MRENFDSAFAELVKNEGDFVDNPADPGGATRYGITERVARENDYIGDMRDLPIELARTIAKKTYWDAIGGDDLPNGLDFTVFDACYNSGESRAKEWLAKAAPKEGELADPIIMRFSAYRLLFMCDLKTWPNFGRGWARRIANNLLHAAS